MTTTHPLKVDRNTRTLRELALEKLRDAILASHFRPGDRLVERELCEQLGVSRTVVREVIRNLESEGLVETVAHRGPQVARLTAADAVQIYEVRAMLEAMAARACAEHAGPGTTKKITAALGEIEAAFHADDIPWVLRATDRFYEIIFDEGGKPLAWNIVKSLNARISFLRALTLSSPGRRPRGRAEMERIVAAIAAGDGEAAHHACMDHVEQARRLAAQIIAER